MPFATVDALRARLLSGLVIPASPLALTSGRSFDERRQRALCRYHVAAGAGGLAVGVHTTQFAIRDPAIGLFEPVLALATDEMERRANADFVRIAGVCGETRQAVREATLARSLGYDAVLLSLAALASATDEALIEHCHAVAEVIPVVGFYLQPSVGGRVLAFEFWRRFVEIENVVAIKIAPFNRYRTLDVVRAVAESGRDDVALYTGNDDNIVNDLLAPFRFRVNGAIVERRIVGGLLGQWSVWTKAAVDLHARCRTVPAPGSAILTELLGLANEVTDANAALFDAANGFRGCIAGLHEILRRQGLLEGRWLLDPTVDLSSGQASEIDRVCVAYPHLNDDAFVRSHLHEWMAHY